MVNMVTNNEVRLAIRCEESTRKEFKELCARMGKDYENGLLTLIRFYKSGVKWA